MRDSNPDLWPGFDSRPRTIFADFLFFYNFLGNRPNNTSASSKFMWKYLKNAKKKLFKHVGHFFWVHGVPFIAFLAILSFFWSKKNFAIFYSWQKVANIFDLRLSMRLLASLTTPQKKVLKFFFALRRLIFSNIFQIWIVPLTVRHPVQGGPS